MIEKIHIMMVEDHEIVRDGIKAILLGNQKIKVIGEASQAQEFFSLLKQKVPDVAILDISLPGMSGIEIAKVLKKEYPQVKILMLSANTHENYIISAVKAGARGFLPKNCPKEEFIAAVQGVYRGQFYFGKNITGAVFETFAQKVQGKKPDPVQNLSDRELEVLLGFAEGLSYKEIAEKLNITTRTVEAHKKSIFEKLQFKNNVDLIKYALKQGLIALD